MLTVGIFSLFFIVMAIALYLIIQVERQAMRHPPEPLAPPTTKPAEAGDSASSITTLGIGKRAMDHRTINPTR